MTVIEFGKYVVDNMHRATLANAMNIADKIDNDEFYTFHDFVDAVNQSVSQSLSENKIDRIKAYKILVAVDKYTKMYDSETKYNTRMVIDNLIISIWECYQ